MSFTTKLYHYRDLPADLLHDILKLRQDVFIIEQTCLYEDIDGKDPVCTHLVLSSSDGDMVGYSRIVPPGAIHNEPSIGRIVVPVSQRGNGTGRRLVEESIRVTREQYPGEKILITAQVHLQPFYESLGFVQTSKPYDDAGIMHIEMILEPPVQRGTS